MHSIALPGHDHEYGVPFLHLLSSCHAYQVHEVKVDAPANPGELCPSGDTSGALRGPVGGAMASVLAVALAVVLAPGVWV